MIWNCIIYPIYPLTMLISLNNGLFLATFVVVVTTQNSQQMLFFHS